MGIDRSAVTRITTVVILGLAAVVCDDASAVRLRGTSSTAVHTQEVAKGAAGGEFETRTRGYERLDFSLTDFAGSRLTFTGHLTARNDFTNESLGETRTRLYRAYLRYLVTPNVRDALRYDARLGRQWIWAGIGSGTLDGLMIQVDRSGWGGLTLFGGTLGIDARDQLRFDSPDDSRRLGGELRLRPVFRDQFEPELAVSFADTWRDDVEETRRLGARGSLIVRRQLKLWSQIRHDYLLDRTYGSAAGIEFLRRSSGLRIWAEYNRRTPALPATSDFAFFDTKPVSELRGGIALRVVGPYRLGFDFGRTDFKEEATTVSVNDSTTVSRSKVDRAKSFRLVLQRGGVQIGGQIQSGFGGDRSRLVIGMNRDFGKRWNVRVDLGYETYDYGPTDWDDNSAKSGLIATTVRPTDDTTITAQLEGLNNRDLKRDVRLLARIDQRFRLGR